MTENNSSDDMISLYMIFIYYFILSYYSNYIILYLHIRQHISLLYTSKYFCKCHNFQDEYVTCCGDTLLNISHHTPVSVHTYPHTHILSIMVILSKKKHITLFVIKTYLPCVYMWCVLQFKQCYHFNIISLFLTNHGY